MKAVILIFSFLLFSQSVFGQSHKHNFVECMFEEFNGQWTYIFSASFVNPFEIKTGEKTSLHYLWWRNPKAAKYPETAICSHVTDTKADGSLEVTSNVHNGKYFYDVANSITCEWEADGAVLQSRVKATLKRGQYFIHKYRRKIPSANRVQLTQYLPTKRETKNMDVDLAEEICFRFEPKN